MAQDLNSLLSKLCKRSLGLFLAASLLMLLFMPLSIAIEIGRMSSQKLVERRKMREERRKMSRIT